MKKYKLYANPNPKYVEKEINKLIKKGFEIYDWKMNNNAICVIMIKED